MKARIGNPALVVPKALDALQDLGKAVHRGGVPAETHHLMHLRASQINGCGVCVDMHARDLRKVGASDERIFSVAAWRETPYYSDEERAALALAESITRLADTSDGVPDEVWNEAAKYYDEAQLASLTLSVAMINLWNRVNAATRQIAADWAA